MMKLARSPGLEMQTRVFGDLDRRAEPNDTSLRDLKCRSERCRVFFFFLSFQFYDVAEVAIIHKKV